MIFAMIRREGQAVQNYRDRQETAWEITHPLLFNSSESSIFAGSKTARLY
jgi:hypothetical protein